MGRREAQSSSFQIGGRLQAAQTLDFLRLTNDEFKTDRAFSPGKSQLVKLTTKVRSLTFVWLDSKSLCAFAYKVILYGFAYNLIRARMIDFCQLNHGKVFSGFAHTTSKINHSNQSVNFRLAQFAAGRQKIKSFSFQIVDRLQAAQTLDFLRLTNDEFKNIWRFALQKSQLVKLTTQSAPLIFVWLDSKGKGGFHEARTH